MAKRMAKRMEWSTELIEWIYKCCKVTGRYRISPIGIIGGVFPKGKCPKCGKKLSIKTFSWKKIEEEEE